jgi:pimeloyl-ACP methyl ester carboxylesterase
VADLQIHEQPLRVWQDRLDLHVQVAGSGPPLVYLHPAPGLTWDPFLQRLAEHYTVHAPQAPGTAPGDPAAIGEVDDLWDLVLIYEEALRGLGLAGAPVIGQSFGGMLACELAAGFPELFSRLVVLDAVGLWRDDAPQPNLLAAAPDRLAELLYHDPSSPAAQAMMAMPEDPDERAAEIARTTWAIGATVRFIWPVPDKGLARRLHRITAPTLIVWGRQDRLVPVVYAQEFGDRIAGSRVEILDDCGHIPQVEQLQRTYELVTRFLA